MSDVRQCRRCNKLFMTRGNPLCPDCLKLLDELFLSVREYLFDHPDASLESVSNETGATPAEIRSWLREGRLILTGSSMLLSCEGCGKSINTGRYCDTCAAQMRDVLRAGAKSIEDSQRRDYMGRSRGDKDKGLHG